MLLRRSSGSESSVVTTRVPSICYLGMYSGISGEDRAILMLLCKPRVKLRPNMGKQQDRLSNQNKRRERLEKSCVRDLCPRLVHRLYRDAVIISSAFLHHAAIKKYSWIDSILTIGTCLGKGGGRNMTQIYNGPLMEKSSQPLVKCLSFNYLHR